MADILHRIRKSARRVVSAYTLHYMHDAACMRIAEPVSREPGRDKDSGCRPACDAGWWQGDTWVDGLYFVINLLAVVDITL
ncbi:hypothetical protein SAMN05421881_10359 [Nitrosomonas halophila]|uniref:Uncharacterized protein n=1 Tax=Nitrosomonas halophila TaxID=44576 RepID=A0A1H3JTJ7_9PROT|nr:hypothetical protein SAMN05421881_10359 [Nitrosomonas halophila]